jgi:hypothetical protein
VRTRARKSINGVAGYTTTSKQERAVARHTVAHFANARQPGEELLLEERGNRAFEVGELSLPKEVSGNRRLALRKLEERRTNAEARLDLIPELPELIDRWLRIVTPSG